MQYITIMYWGFVVASAILLKLTTKFFDNTRSNEIQKILLLVASYVFISYADIRFTLALVILTIVTWWTSKKSNRLKMGVIFAVMMLGYFKYTNFFIGSFASVFNIRVNSLKIILPLGISFYTFSAISYMVEVNQGKEKQRSFTDLALYLSYFPKLTSGPIQKSTDFFNQIDQGLEINWQKVSNGIQIFCFGMFKKMVLADRLSVFVDQVYATPTVFSGQTVLLATMAYSLQIYFDFSGYSDMAIGSSKILGIDLPKNFNLPYMAHNVTEFWKRWHITLSNWLMMYIYIPLGGNRKGKLRQYLNLFLTMLIGGIWHGANWTYIIWGMLHGTALIIHKIWMKVTNSATKEPRPIVKVCNIFITYIFISICWIFFKAESLTKALVIIKLISTNHAGVSHPYMWLTISFIVYVIALLFAFNQSKEYSRDVKPNNSWVNGYYPIQDLTTIKGMTIFFIFLGLIIGFAYTGGSPFIYGAY